MPFENVHGNGGLLTTVGDLLRWNENFVSPKVGDAAFVAEQQMPGRFTDGRRMTTPSACTSRRIAASGKSVTADRPPAIARSSRAFPISTSRSRCCATRRARIRLNMRMPLRKPIWVRPVAGFGHRRRPAAERRGAAASRPEQADLRVYAGRYASDEAETILTVALTAPIW